MLLDNTIISMGMHVNSTSSELIGRGANHLTRCVSIQLNADVVLKDLIFNMNSKSETSFKQVNNCKNLDIAEEKKNMFFYYH